MSRDLTKDLSEIETLSGRMDFNPSTVTELLELERAGEKGLLSNLANDYAARLPQLLGALDRAANTQEWSALEHAAHSLKSSSYLLGFERAGDLCSTLEEAGRNGHDEAHARKQIATVVQTAQIKLNEFMSEQLAAASDIRRSA